jgi:enoyl-CoA hydratase
MVQRLGDLEVALAWAAEIASLAPLTIAGHKLTLERDAADPAVADAFARAWASADVREGRAAFHERRTPKFTGT